MAINWIPQIEYDPGSGPVIITFDFPVRKEPFGQSIKFSGKVQESESGRLQTLTNFIAETNKLTFSHVSQTLFEAMEIFLKTHAIQGKEFLFSFDNTDVTTKFTMQLSKRSRSPDWKVISATGVDTWLRRITLTFRRVL